MRQCVKVLNIQRMALTILTLDVLAMSVIVLIVCGCGTVRCE